MEPPRDTALVTGASSGIGVELARELARRGVDLVLTARREERLEKLAAELRKDHGVEVHVIPCDLAEPDSAEQLFAAIEERKLAITILVNNAGFGRYTEFVYHKPEDITSMLQVNVATLTQLARRFAPKMQQQGRGYILNTASYAGMQPVPGQSVYSATKAYVIAFSQTLRYELKSSGVRVSALCPGFVDTEFNYVSRWNSTFFIRLLSLKAPQVARAGIAGMYKGKDLIIPSLAYKLFAFMLRLQPRSLSVAIAHMIGKN